MSNQKRRLAERGGRRQSQTTYVDVQAHYSPINKATGDYSRAKDHDGNYIVERVEKSSRPAQKGKSFYYDKPRIETEVEVYVSKRIPYRRRVEVK